MIFWDILDIDIDQDYLKSKLYFFFKYCHLWSTPWDRASEHVAGPKEQMVGLRETITLGPVPENPLLWAQSQSI